MTGAAAADGGDGCRTESDASEGLEVRDQCVGSLGRSAHGDDQLVAPPGAEVRVGALGRDLDADTSPGVALVCQGGQPQ